MSIGAINLTQSKTFSSTPTRDKIKLQHIYQEHKEKMKTMKALMKFMNTIIVDMRPQVKFLAAS